MPMQDPRNKASRSIAQTAVLMAVLSLGTKVLGFVRELLLAGQYGTTYVVDAFVMAQNIPVFFLGGVTGAIGAAYLLVFSRITEQEGRPEGHRFTNRILTVTQLIVLVSIVLGLVFSEQLVTLFAANFSPEAAALTEKYLRITLFYPLLTSTCSILDSYLRYNDLYLRTVFSGYLYDIGAIAVLFLCLYTGHQYLAFSMLAGYLLQFLLLYGSARGCGLRYRPDVDLGGAVRQVLTLAIPVFVSSSIYQINTMVDRMLASGLQEGSIAALNYGHLLATLIHSLTVIVLGSILSPKMTKAANTKDWTSFYLMAEQSVTVILLIALPFSLGGMVFSRQVVQVIFERGSFAGASTGLTGSAFFYYAAGLVFMALNHLFAIIFHSQQEMKSPLICSAASVAVNIALNLALVGPMEHRGLALATSIAAAVHCLLLVIFLKKRGLDAVLPSAGKLLRILAASLIAVAGAVLVYQLVQLVWMPRVVYLMLAVLFAMALYLLLLSLLKIREVELLKTLLRK